MTNAKFLRKLHEVHGNDIIPLEIYKGCNIRIWFKCKRCGHKWKTRPCNILRGHGCHYCARCHRKNPLRISNREFRHAVYKISHGEITPLEKYKGSNVKIWCRCNICSNKWKAIPSNLLTGSGCPKCAVRKRSANGRIPNKIFLKRLYKVSHGKITPLEKYKGSNIKIWCQCNVCGRKWKATPNMLLKGTGCPSCADKRIARSHTLTDKEARKKIHAIHRNKITMLQTYKGQMIKRTFRCNVCGNVWRTMPYYIMHGSGCPVCSQKKARINSIIPDKIIRQRIRKVHGNKISMLQRYKGSQVKRLFRCNVCGHIWKVYPYSIIHGSGCPVCSIKRSHLKTTSTDAAVRRKIHKIHGNKISMLQRYKSSQVKRLFHCNVCGYVWSAEPNCIMRGESCPYCAKHNGSYGEQYIYHWLRHHLRARFIYGYTIPSNNLHLDFWIPSQHLAIEFDGVQHFKYTPYFCGNNPKRFKESIHRDCCKNHYCLQNHITLIRIQNFNEYTNYKRLRHTINHILSRVFSAYYHHHLLTHIYRFDVNHHGRLIRNRKQSA